MSSQTMTAPAVGHRPPDPGSDTPMYDYGGSQNDSSPPTDARSDSAIRDMHNPTPTSKGLPATPIGIKKEPVEGHDLAGPEMQKNINTQSAAGALLAQLLGNQPAPTNSAPTPGLQPLETQNGTETRIETGTAPPQDVKMGDVDVQLDQKPDLNNDTSLNFNLPQDGQQTSASIGIQSMSNGGKSTDDIFAQLDATPRDETQTGHRGSDAMDISDPLNTAKTDLDQQPSLLPPLDFALGPKNALEALQQNEILTAAYLSQSADLSALGYQDGSTSVAGSEPRIQAFAKLEFDDGHFYCNTYSFILGRDVRAARAAHQREYQYRQAVRSSRAKSSSGGNTSHTPNRMKREESAAMMGSVVSDRGGIMGFDPDVPPNISGNNLPGKLDMNRRSSKSSFDGSVVPLHANPAQLQAPTDYNALAMQSLQDGNGDPKPVDTLALLPSPDSCPTIPIHPPSTIDGTAAGHRGISRRHVRIAYNFDRNLFEMEVMGRNGAFIGADWLSPGQVRPLHSGDYIQIGGVRIRFLLPDVPIGETGADRIEEQPPEEEEADRGSVDAEHEIDDTDKPLSDSESREPSSKVTKLILKTKDSDSSKALPSIEAGGENSGQPARRRGPGRPPKDGIMSKRERAELAREQKMAAKREANGGVTPPPPVIPTKTSGKAGKTVKESVGAESPPSSVKPSEKRKYTKRKKGEGVDFPLPSTEGGQFTTEQRPEEYVKPPPVKKRKNSRSPSPNYPPESAYTTEDLAKPPYNYAVLIFDALTEAGNPMTLKQIYRALKLKYPYFRFKCETEGWTSSVRHNLNGNSHLFMHAERDGKGWSWQLRPGASVEKEKKRRPSPPPPQPPQTSVPPPQHYMPPMPHSYAPPTGGPASMQNQHQHQHQHFQFPSIPSANSFSAPSAPPQQQHTSPYAPPPASAAPPPPAPAVIPPVSAPAPPAGQPPAPAPTPVSVAAPLSIPATAPAPAPAPIPAPTPAPAPASFPIPTALRGNLPAAFARTTPGTYTSPYASNPPPQVLQQQQPPPQHSQARPQPQPQTQPIQGPPGQQPSQQHQPQQQQHHSPYPPPQKPPSTSQPHTPSQSHSYPPPAAPQYQPQHQHPIQQPVQMQHQQHQQNSHQAPPHQHVPPPHHQSRPPHPPPPGPQPHHHQPPPPHHQPQHQPQHHTLQSVPPPPAPPDSPSFTERANKAIDDFENVLMEDYEDKNYIREVLRSARARVLGNASESSFPGGEPKDEAVIMDVLRNLVGSLKEE